MGTVSIRNVETGTELLLDRPAAMPAQGVDVGLKLRTVRTMYPGNSIPSVQVMGTEDVPLVLRGTWRDSLLQETNGAQALAAAARRLLREQGACELVWADDDGDTPLVRRGVVTEVTVTQRRRDWVDWSITYQVDEADEPEIIAVPAPPAATSADLMTQLRQLLAALDAAYDLAVGINNVIKALT